MAYSSAVERALALAAERHGVDPSLLRSFVAIESGGNPSNVTGSYRGLMQLSPQEFARYGGRGDIHDPEANAVAGAAKIAAESAAFQQKYGRTPTAADIYLIHQQGEGGAAAHWANPDAQAWQNMLSTGEGRQKVAQRGQDYAENWARQAIWGNLPGAEKRRFGSVDNVTSKDFTDFWNSRVARAGGGDGSSNAIAGLGASAAAPAVSSSDASNTVTLADASGPSDAPLFLGAPSSKIEQALKLADAVSPKQQMLRPVDILHPTQSLGGGASEGLKMAQASGLAGGSNQTFASGGAVEDVGDDTGSNVPESLDSLLAQQKQLIEGRRPAQMYPLGTRELPLPSGMERVQLPRGVYHYNPKLISPERIASASMSGRENDILGLGPLSKNDVLAQARATGEGPVVVTERDPFGAELKASLATPSTAHLQADGIAQSKAPDSSIGLEPVDGVVGQRSGGGGMIDRALKLAQSLMPRRAEGGSVGSGPKHGAERFYQDLNDPQLSRMPFPTPEMREHPTLPSQRVKDTIGNTAYTLGDMLTLGIPAFNADNAARTLDAMQSDHPDVARTAPMVGAVNSVLGTGVLAGLPYGLGRAARAMHGAAATPSAAGADAIAQASRVAEMDAILERLRGIVREDMAAQRAMETAGRASDGAVGAGSSSRVPYGFSKDTGQHQIIGTQGRYDAGETMAGYNARERVIDQTGMSNGMSLTDENIARIGSVDTARPHIGGTQIGTPPPQTVGPNGINTDYLDILKHLDTGATTMHASGGRIVDRAMSLARPRKAEGGGLSDPIDAEFEDVGPSVTTDDILSQMRHNRVSDYWGQPGSGHLPPLPPPSTYEMRGRGPGESRDPYAGFDDTLEAKVARGIPDAVMAVNPTAATVGTGIGLAYGLLRPGEAAAQESGIVDRLKAMSPEELRAYQKRIGVNPDGVLGGTTIGAAQRFESEARARRDADNAAAMEASRIGAQGQANATVEAARIKAAAEAELAKARGISELATDEGKRPLAEAHPWLARGSQAVGLGLGALVPAYLSRGKFRQLAGITEMADQSRKAMAAGNISEGLAGDAAATAMAGKYVSPGFKDAAKNAGIGGFLGWEGAVLPYEIDAGRAAPGSKEQKDALSSIVDPWRVIPSVVGGAGFGMTGQKLALRNIGAAEAAADGSRAALSRTLESGFADDVANASRAAERTAAGDARAISASSDVDKVRQVAGDAAAQSRAESDAIHQAALEALRRGLSPSQRKELVDGLVQRYGGPGAFGGQELAPVNPPLPSAALPNPASNSPLLPSPLQSNGAGSVPQGAAGRALALTRDPALSEPIGGGAGAAAAKIKWDDAAHGQHARDFLAENAGNLDKLHPVDIARHYESRGVRPPDMKDIEKRLDRTRGLIAHTISERKAAGLPVGEKDIADIIRRLPAGVGIDAKGKVVDPLLGIGAGIAGGSAVSNGGGEAQGDADAGLFASGGAVAKALKLAGHPVVNQPVRGPHLPHVGPIMGASPGRADHVPMAVPAGAHVVPADIVSSLGQGNTHAGMNVLSKMFKSGPYGVPAKPTKLAEGGAVPIMASDGEFVIDPAMVAEIGGGDPNYGHDVLDQWILNARRKAIETMQNLAPPATD